MFMNAKCLRALCASPRAAARTRARVQWRLPRAYVCARETERERERERERGEKETRGDGSPSREGVSTLGELPFGAGNNGTRVRRALLPSTAFRSGAPASGRAKDGSFFPYLRPRLTSFVNTLKGKRRTSCSHRASFRVHYSKILTLSCARSRPSRRGYR